MKLTLKQRNHDRVSLWAMEEKHLRAYIAGGTDQATEPNDNPEFFIDDGIALVPIIGPVTKYDGLELQAFGGTSTLETANILRDLAGNDQVKCILLYVDSPGGSTAGTADLADLISQISQTKRIEAYVSDRCFSAAYWIASQADKITSNKGGFVGSIGVYTVLYDTSEQAKQAGVTVHLVKAGEEKGVGEPGVPISEASLQATQDEIDAVYKQFVSAVAAGRGMGEQEAQTLADGKVHIADKALSIGLIDSIGSLDDAIKSLKETMAENKNETAPEQVQPDINQVADLQKQIAELSGQLEALQQARKESDTKAEADKNRLANIKAIAPDRPEFVLEQFAKGNDATTAKAELADVLAVEVAELKKKFSAGGIEPVAQKPAGSTIVSDDPDVIWQKNLNDVHAAYRGDKEAFLAVYKHEKKLARSH